MGSSAMFIQAPRVNVSKHVVLAMMLHGCEDDRVTRSLAMGDRFSSRRIPSWPACLAGLS